MFIIVIIAIGGILAGPIMSDVEIPAYNIIDKKGSIEIRHYEPMIIAEVMINNSRKEAIGEGFRLLADYIFGNNMAKTKIAMTAPVQQQKDINSIINVSLNEKSLDESWYISFIMPSKYTLDKLPIPVDSRVVLKEIDVKKFIVITFSGKNSDDNIEKYTKKLKKYMFREKKCLK